MSQQLGKLFQISLLEIISFVNLYLLLIICKKWFYFILDYYFILISLVHIRRRKDQKKNIRKCLNI